MRDARHRSNRGRRLCGAIAHAAVLVAFTACFDPIGPIGLDFSGVCASGCGPSAWLLMDPQTIRMLRGDTTRVSAWYCSRNNSCDTSATLRWSTTTDDSIIRFDVGGELQALVDSRHSVLVRGVGRGVSTIGASRADSVSATVQVTVADSSEITAIRVNRIGLGKDTARVDVPAAFEVRFMDGNGRTISAAPTAWSLSDSTVLAVTRTTVGRLAFLMTVVGLTPGRADLRIHFLGLTKVVALTVVP